MEKVKLITSEKCGPCKELKEHLDRKEVDYEEKDIFKDSNDIEYSGAIILPTLIIGDREIKGYNQEKVEEVID